LSNENDCGPSHKQRPVILADRRNAKMARSAHAYMRGNTVKFYEWLDTAAGKSFPGGPPVWICLLATLSSTKAAWDQFVLISIALQPFSKIWVGKLYESLGALGDGLSL
jgi:uncharacterized protein (DUF2252 family)